MTAITKPRNTKQMQGYPLPGVMAYPVAANEVLYQGTLCMIKLGYLYDGATTTGAQGVGMVDPNEPDLDNTGGADGDLIANVLPGIFQWGNSANADLIEDEEVVAALRARRLATAAVRLVSLSARRCAYIAS